MVAGVLASYYIRPAGSATSTTTSSSQTSTTTSSSQATTQSGFNFSIGEAFHIPTNRALQVLVRYFYYNSTSPPESFDFSGGQEIIIEGFSEQAKGTFEAASNFTVVSNTSSVSMGGPGNQSEGIPVMYQISLKEPASNGTYTLNFGWLYPSLEACAVDFQIAVGNGIPNYSWIGGCTAPLSTYHPLNSNGFVNGFLTAEIVEVSNSTLTSGNLRAPTLPSTSSSKKVRSVQCIKFRPVNSQKNAI